MTYKSATPPLCRWCGKPIRKATRTAFFGQERPAHSDFFINKPERPRSLAEAQRLVNGQIVSNTWRSPLNYGGEKFDRYIDKVTIWDGESYADEFFDTGTCARYMGYSAAQAPHHLTTKAYRAAKAGATP